MIAILADGGAEIVEPPMRGPISFSEIGFHLHGEVFVVMGAVLALWLWAIRRYGPEHAPAGAPPVTRRQQLLFGSGMLILLANAVWPIHDISERLLFSVHMTQHTMFSLVAPPLLIMGTPPWLLRVLVRPRAIGGSLRLLARPLVAGLLFNAVVVITHIPAMVEYVTPVEWKHFVAHVVLFGASMLMWLPVVNVLPELPRMSYPMRGVYLFLQSIIPTVPASFLTFAEKPLYDLYANAPRLWGMGVIEDQQLAGAIMKVGGATLLWGCIIGIFYRWYASNHRDTVADLLTWDDVAAEFERSPAPVEVR